MKYKQFLFRIDMFKEIHILFIILSILFCALCGQNIDHNVMRAYFFILFGTLWAALEVQIEGEHGWAEKLPTSSFFGTHFTWYHVIMNLMVFVLVFQIVELTWALPFWLSSLFLIEDYMWFMINPAFGIHKYNAENVHWHVWFFHMPIGNWISALIMLTTSYVHYLMDNDIILFIMSGVIFAYLVSVSIFNAILTTKNIVTDKIKKQEKITF